MPTAPTELLLSVAHAHHTAGRHAEAEALYQQVLLQQPDHSAALNRLGVLLLQTKRSDAALVRLRQADAADPNNARVLSNLGAALRQTGSVREAIETLQQAVRIDPTLAMAQMNLAAALLDEDRPTEALVAAEASLAIDPTRADAHVNRGNALKAIFRWDDAIEAYHTALALDPKAAAAHSNLGVALAQLNDLGGAIDHYQKAIEIDPNYAEAFGNLANALAARGDLESALVAARHGCRQSPADVHGHWNLAVVLLSRGDYLAGFEEYEWRFRQRGDKSQARFSMPRWNGESLVGKSILLHAEQGFGDAIQFVRYAPLVADRGASVILECHPELKKLFESVRGLTQVIARGDPLPATDFHCPLMSLALVFGTALDTVPASVPYFGLLRFREIEQSSSYNETSRYPEMIPDSAVAPVVGKPDGYPSGSPANRKVLPERRLKVGLVWAGNPKHRNDSRRSIAFDQLGPLLAVGVDFVSLQRDSTENLPSAVGDDFSQTAKSIGQLDLVIAVDTAVAHLCGALAMPTWILLPAGPDWRWLTGRDDSPWYPTVRLFRQTTRDDWTDVIQRVAAALAERIAPRAAAC